MKLGFLAWTGHLLFDQLVYFSHDNVNTYKKATDNAVAFKLQSVLEQYAYANCAFNFMQHI